MNPVHRRPLLTGTILLVGVVAFLLMITIGFYVRDTNRNTEIERREVRLHRIETGDNLEVLCRNQERIDKRLSRIEDFLGVEVEPNGSLSCPDPVDFNESGLGH